MDRRSWIAVGCCLGLLVVLTGCVWKRLGDTYHRHLNLNWDRNDTWRVRVRFWPQRLSDPFTRTATRRQRTWSYSVEETPGSGDSNKYKIIQRSGSTRYLLLFGSGFNLLEVHRLRDSIDGFWRTRRVRDNQLGGTAFFYRATDGSHPPVFWHHPAMRGRRLQGSSRLNFSTLGRPTGDWINQSVTRTGGGLEFKIVHAGSSTRVAFRWRRGQPWWQQAEWYHRERLIALARRVLPGDRETTDPELPAPTFR